MSVASKVVQVMGAIGAVKSDKSNDYQRFSYVSAELILTTARKHMHDVGLVCIPAMTNITQTDTTYLISYEFTLIDVDDPENPMVQHWAQSIPIESKSTKGNYIDDKAIGKATTYAHKYFLKKLFLVSDKDDDDIDSSDSSQYAKNNQQQKQPQKPNKSGSKPSGNKPSGSTTSDFWTLIYTDSDLLQAYEHKNHIANAVNQYGDSAMADGFDKVKAWLLNRKAS
jgi:hypothetical protein